MRRLRLKNQQLAAMALESLRSDIPEKDANDISEFIYTHREWGLGLEQLIGCLLEENIPVTDAQWEYIQAAAVAMNIEFGQDQIRRI